MEGLPVIRHRRFPVHPSVLIALGVESLDIPDNVRVVTLEDGVERVLPVVACSWPACARCQPSGWEEFLLPEEGARRYQKGGTRFPYLGPWCHRGSQRDRYWPGILRGDEVVRHSLPLLRVLFARPSMSCACPVRAGRASLTLPVLPGG